MKHGVSLAAVLLIVLCCISTSVWSATTGRVTGVITDAQTNEPLLGVSVSLLGTTLGAVTDEEGFYAILNVQVGTYSLRMSSVGYNSVEVTNVSVSADLATYQDQPLTTSTTELDEVIYVRAERPMVIPDKVASIQIVTAEELLALPTRGFADVVGIQSGVVAVNTNQQQLRGLRGARESTNGVELNIRGGRASEVAYYVDGFSQQDPLTGSSSSNISNNAIKEVSIISGGFPVEYGHVASGIVNVITKSGSDKYSGTAEAVGDPVYEQTWLSGTLSGPIPGLEKGHFFGSVERRNHEDREPSSIADEVISAIPDSLRTQFRLEDDDRLPGNWLNGYAYQGKLDYDFTQNIKLALNGTGSKDKWSEYRHSYLFTNGHTPYYEDKNIGLNARLTHTLNATTFYNLSAAYFVTERFRGDGVHKQDIWAYGRPEGNPRNDPENLFRSWDDPTTAIETESHWVPTDTMTVLSSTGADSLIAIDSVQKTFRTGGYEAHLWEDYLKRKSSYMGFSGSITSELNREHTIKAGFEFNRHTLRFFQHFFPQNFDRGVGFGGTQDENRYGYDEFGEESDDEDWRTEAKNPIDLGLYIQDRLEYQGLIVTAGLRFDYFDYKTDRLRNEDLPLDPDSLRFDNDPNNDDEVATLELADLEDSEKFTRVSPRIGIAFPISDRTQMRVSYGKFFQRPELQNLFVGYTFLEYKIRTGGYYVSFGNPNLEPPKTTAYEIGITNQLGENTTFDVNVFYRDVTDLVQVVNQPSFPTSFATYRNNDYGTIKGLEFALKMRRTRYISLHFKYTLSYASGTGSFANTQGNVAWVNANAPKQTAPLDFDQRHTLNGVVDVRFGSQQGPRVGDTYILENFGINVLMQASSGLPYTPINIINEATLGAFAPIPRDTRNSEYTPWTFIIDLKLEKSFDVRQFKITPYLWVKNVLDRDNITNVWEGTGRGETTGWLETPSGQDFVNSFSDEDDTGLNGEDKYDVAQNHPQNYSNPRQFLFGLRMSF